MKVIVNILNVRKVRRSLVVEDCDELVWNKVLDVIEKSFMFKEE